MTQLSLFPDEAPRHYDRDLPRSYSSKPKPQKKEPNELDVSKLEETIIEEYADLRIETDESFRLLNQARKYADSEPHEKKAFLQRNHPKFRGESNKAPQNISAYSDNQIFGLFNRLLRSYEKKFNENLVKYRAFYKKNEVILRNNTL